MGEGETVGERRMGVGRGEVGKKRERGRGVMKGKEGRYAI